MKKEVLKIFFFDWSSRFARQKWMKTEEKRYNINTRGWGSELTIALCKLCSPRVAEIDHTHIHTHTYTHIHTHTYTLSHFPHHSSLCQTLFPYDSSLCLIPSILQFLFSTAKWSFSLAIWLTPKPSTLWSLTKKRGTSYLTAQEKPDPAKTTKSIRLERERERESDLNRFFSTPTPLP